MPFDAAEERSPRSASWRQDQAAASQPPSCRGDAEAPLKPQAIRCLWICLLSVGSGGRT